MTPKKRKATTEDQEEQETTDNADKSWHQILEEATLSAPLSTPPRVRRRYVGVRQRPSGRWVAEIKDTIQKIRLWLGTYDTAEEAARAYDEAACMLRGANTRTNFWPNRSQSFQNSPPILPTKITNLLLHRLRASYQNSSLSLLNTSLGNVSDTPSQETANLGGTQLDDFFNVNESFDLFENCDSFTSPTSASESSFTVSTKDHGDDWANTDENCYNTQGLDTGLVDFECLDDLRSSCDYSPFEITEEIMGPIEQDNDGELKETMKMMKYERRFSASLYAINGIPECLKLKLASDENGNRKGKSAQVCNLENNLEEKKFVVKDESHKEQVGMNREMSKDEDMSTSSSLSNEGGELRIWRCHDFPPIYF